eukprot:754794-Hanusia_phi.AAC.6
MEVKVIVREVMVVVVVEEEEETHSGPSPLNVCCIKPVTAHLDQSAGAVVCQASHQLVCVCSSSRRNLRCPVRWEAAGIDLPAPSSADHLDIAIA